MTQVSIIPVAENNQRIVHPLFLRIVVAGIPDRTLTIGKEPYLESLLSPLRHFILLKEQLVPYVGDHEFLIDYEQPAHEHRNENDRPDHAVKAYARSEHCGQLIAVIHPGDGERGRDNYDDPPHLGEKDERIEEVIPENITYQNQRGISILGEFLHVLCELVHFDEQMDHDPQGHQYDEPHKQGL